MDRISHLISESVEFITWIVGFGFFAAAYAIGCVVITSVRNLSNKIVSAVPCRLSRSNAALLVRGILLSIALALFLIYRPPVIDIVHTFIHIEDFNEIANILVSHKNKFVLNIVMNTLLNQLVILLVTCAPLFIGKAVIAFSEQALCDREGSSNQSSWISVLNLIELLAMNVVIICLNDSSFYFALGLVQGAKNDLLSLLLFILFFVFVIQELFSDDILLAMIAVNTLAAMCDVSITPNNYLYFFSSAVICGMLFTLFRQRILRKIGKWSDIGNILLGFGTIALTAILCNMAIWPLMEHLLPGIIYGP